MKAIIEHLRLPFSLLLLPVFLFALIQNSNPVSVFNFNIIILFVILHLLVYPSSNGYNSLQDKDIGSIGLIKEPQKVPKQMGIVTIILDVLAVLISLYFKNLQVSLLILGYIAFSRLYSYRRIRLKQYAIIGFITVFIFQGFVIFYLTSLLFTKDVNCLLGIASSCLIGSMYPLSQIYQHQQDGADNVKTLSMLLGYKGTFIFSAILFAIGASIILHSFYTNGRISAMLIYLILGMPVIGYFFWWAKKVWQTTVNANYLNTMRMNIVSCLCLNLTFLLIYLLKY